MAASAVAPVAMIGSTRIASDAAAVLGGASRVGEPEDSGRW